MDKQHTHNTIKSGFTLVEMSVVLAVIALVMGGVFVGQYMITRANMTSVMSDLQKYKTAYDNFITQYKSPPGDLPDATEYWGADTASACSTSPVAGDRVPKKATCNGDGTGTIYFVTAISSGYNQIEIPRAWQHLANAGYIDGLYTGVGSTLGASVIEGGVNAPNSVFQGVSSAFMTLGNVSGDASYYDGSYGTVVFTGTSYSWGSNPIGGFLSPKQQFAIDTKMDDGKPGTGILRIRHANNVGCATNTTNAATARYDQTNTAAVCSIFYTVDQRSKDKP